MSAAVGEASDGKDKRSFVVAPEILPIPDIATMPVSPDHAHCAGRADSMASNDRLKLPILALGCDLVLLTIMIPFKHSISLFSTAQITRLHHVLFAY